MKQIRSKKGVELSLNIVVIGVVLLIILAIVLFIFGTQINNQQGVLDGLTTGAEKSASSKSGEGIVSQYVCTTANPSSDPTKCKCVNGKWVLKADPTQDCK